MICYNFFQVRATQWKIWIKVDLINVTGFSYVGEISIWQEQKFDKCYNFVKRKGVYEGDVSNSTKPIWHKIIYELAEELLKLVDSKFIGEYRDYYIMVSTMKPNEGATNNESSEDGMFQHCGN